MSYKSKYPRDLQQSTLFPDFCPIPKTQRSGRPFCLSGTRSMESFDFLSFIHGKAGASLRAAVGPWIKTYPGRRSTYPKINFHFVTKRMSSRQLLFSFLPGSCSDSQTEHSQRLWNAQHLGEKPTNRHWKEAKKPCPRQNHNTLLLLLVADHQQQSFISIALFFSAAQNLVGQWEATLKLLCRTEVLKLARLGGPVSL